METSTKYISVGSVDDRKRVQNSIRISPSQVQRGSAHRRKLRVGSGHGTRSTGSSAKGDYRTGASRESGFYSQYSIVPKKDGGLGPSLDLRQLN